MTRQIVIDALKTDEMDDAFTFVDNHGETVTVEVGMKYATGYGRTITVEGWELRGLRKQPIVYGIRPGDWDEPYRGWATLQTLEYAIPTEE